MIESAPALAHAHARMRVTRCILHKRCQLFIVRSFSQLLKAQEKE
jgi:hypothetical protein